MPPGDGVWTVSAEILTTPCATVTHTPARKDVRNAVAALDLRQFLELFKQVGQLASPAGSALSSLVLRMEPLPKPRRDPKMPGSNSPTPKAKKEAGNAPNRQADERKRQRVVVMAQQMNKR
jgi:hypothetical protein